MSYTFNNYALSDSCMTSRMVSKVAMEVEPCRLGTHPLQIEFHQRYTADDFQVQWYMLKSAPLHSVEACEREAQCKDGAQPTTASYGIIIDSIRDLSHDTPFKDMDVIKEPWR